ncbi:MAG: hypothetical protein QM541_01830 [Flavobacterium sp.]|nr:hypothetical protein [Flavobacterium sp.]
MQIANAKYHNTCLTCQCVTGMGACATCNTNNTNLNYYYNFTQSIATYTLVFAQLGPKLAVAACNPGKLYQYYCPNSSNTS